ncbi:MAG: trypsin-like serine protease, partial [Bacteroidota bacterium]
MSYQDVLPMAVDKFLQKKSHISNDYREEIIGDNDRVPVGIDYPFKCIALLKITDHLNRTFPGTGFFISERCLITAGHCVYPDGQWAKKIEVIPAAKGQKRPYGSSIESRFRTVRGYINKEGDGQGSEYDYGAIILKNDHFYKQIQAYLGYELIREPIPEDQLELKLSGYAFDTYQIQHQSVGRIEEIETRRIFYDLDTEKGNSGSPLYRGRNGAPIRVTGIHTHGDKTKKVNSGVRLTTGSMKRWNEWSQIN